MKIIDFKERNALIGEHQPEYLTVPAHQVKDKDGTTFFRIQFNEEELAELNRTSGMWMSQLNFDRKFTPFMVYAKSPFPYLQPITRELSAIYFKDINSVYFYTPEGDPIKQVTPELFGTWYPVEGYDTFSWYRVMQFPKPGSLIMPDGSQEMVTVLNISYDMKTGGAKTLNNQFYHKDEN